MTKTKKSVHRLLKKKRIIRIAKSFKNRSKSCYRLSKQRVNNSLLHSYKGRKTRKRIINKIWVKTINNKILEYKLKYSAFMCNKNCSFNNIDKKNLFFLFYKNFRIFRAMIKNI